MKSVVVFVVTAFCALTIGTFAGTAAAEDGSAGVPVVSSTGSGGDSGWGR
ncbi:hypothetical protein ACFWYX_04445 [[Kitasatospora] papulosa]